MQTVNIKADSAFPVPGSRARLRFMIWVLFFSGLAAWVAAAVAVDRCENRINPRPRDIRVIEATFWPLLAPGVVMQWRRN